MEKNRKMENLQPGKWLGSEQEMLEMKTDSKSLIELTEYNGLALWWFVRFRIYNSAQSTRLLNLAIKNPYIFSLAEFLYDSITSILSKVLSSFYSVELEGKKQKVLMIAPNLQWRTMRDMGGELTKCDVFLDSVMNELEKRHFDVVTVSPFKYSPSGLKTMIEKLHCQKIAIHKEFNTYWSARIWKKGYDARKHFRNTWREVSRRDGKFLRSLEKYELACELPVYFNSVLGHVGKTIEMAKQLVQKEKPDLIMVSSEYGIFEKSLVVAGKLQGIPTLAIQHGNIGPLHKGYIYPRNSVSPFGSIEAPYCPIPDRTAVYGQYYYDILTKMSSYPPDSVVITGQPRYDVLAVADRVYSKEEFCKRLDLDSHKKIVLVGTENIGITEGRTFLRSVLNALKDFPDLQVIVKPHPGEKGEWYKDILEQEGVRAVVLSRDADTFEALYACDLFFTGFSTIATEGVILGKVGVTLHMDEGEDPTPYYEKVTLRVCREADLVPAIEKALYDEKTREKIKAEGKRFVYDHAYRQDGKATERLVNLIERMIKKS
jgi:hypothetical protein